MYYKYSLPDGLDEDIAEVVNLSTDDEEETNPTTGAFLLLSMPVMALGAVFATKKRK